MHAPESSPASLPPSPCDLLTVGQNQVRLLRDGKEAYPAMLEAIGRAKREILLEMYWFQGDETGRRFRDGLVARARDGIAVRVTYDAMGSFGVPRDMWEPLVRAGGQVFEFGPVHPWRRRFRLDRIDQRDHRKLLVIDGDTGFTGGLNIGDAWSYERAGDSAWRDDAVEVRGPVAGDMRAVFYRTWKQSGFAVPADVPRLTRRPTSRVAILLNRGGLGRSIRRAYGTAARHARSRIDIANPYFLPGPVFVSHLKRAAKRGVEVRILLPGKSDVWLVSMAMGHVVGSLLEHGVRVFAYQGRVLHTKTAIFDSTVATIGTYNLDARSRHYNRECNVVVYDRAFAERVRASFEHDLVDSVELSPDAWRQRPLAQRLFAWFAYPMRQFL